MRDIKFPRLLVSKFCATISSTRLLVPQLLVPATFSSNFFSKHCATSRLLVPATFCFLILRDNKSPRLFVFEFCATINPSDFLSRDFFYRQLFLPANFSFLTQKNRATFINRGQICKNLHKIEEILKSHVHNPRH